MDISKYDLLNNEAAMAAGLIASGLTWFRKMDFTKNSYQMQGFFSLSIGLERMIKLITVYDYRTLNSNAFSDDKYLRKAYGHDLEKLFAKCDEVRIFHMKEAAGLDDPIDI